MRKAEIETRRIRKEWRQGSMHEKRRGRKVRS